jgi:hypothetical protein
MNRKLQFLVCGDYVNMFGENMIYLKNTRRLCQRLVKLVVCSGANVRVRLLTAQCPVVAAAAVCKHWVFPFRRS